MSYISVQHNNIVHVGDENTVIVNAANKYGLTEGIEGVNRSITEAAGPAFKQWRESLPSIKSTEKIDKDVDVPVSYTHLTLPTN